jgi:hypothetical protein
MFQSDDLLEATVDLERLLWLGVGQALASLADPRVLDAVDQPPGGVVRPGHVPAQPAAPYLLGTFSGAGAASPLIAASSRTWWRPLVGDQDPDEHLQVGGNAVDFLGFHHRLVRSRARPGTGEAPTWADGPHPAVNVAGRAGVPSLDG